MEQDQIHPVVIALERLEISSDGPASGFVTQENSVEAAGDFSGDFRQSMHLSAAGGELHLEFFPEVVMELLQGFDQQEVEREPDRPAPIRVSAE